MSDSIENFNKSVNADDKEVTKISFLKRRKSILIAVALILVFALVVYLNFGGSFDSAVENYVNANYYCDFDSAVNIFPEEALNYMLQGSGITKEAYNDQIKKTKEDYAGTVSGFCWCNQGIRFQMGDKAEYAGYFVASTACCIF